jgi:hypothetical protein
VRVRRDTYAYNYDSSSELSDSIQHQQAKVDAQGNTEKITDIDIPSRPKSEIELVWLQVIVISRECLKEVEHAYEGK